MSRRKLKRFEEIKTFTNTFEYPLEMKGKWNDLHFKNDNPIILELGCGKGEYTVGLSDLYQGKNFIGIDLKGSRLWKGAKICTMENRVNAAFIRSRIELIEHYFNPGEIEEIWITFPDPQPRDKWEKKRLTSPGYLNLYKKLMKQGGLIHLKTDNSFLYDYTLTTAKKLDLCIEFHHNDVYGVPDGDAFLFIETTYERIFKQKGATIKYIRIRI